MKADDVLDLNDRVIDQDAGHQGYREQADTIEAETQKVHDGKGRNHRQGNRHAGDDGCSPVAQEDEHHQHRQEGALDERQHRTVKRITRRLHPVGELGQRQPGIFFQKVIKTLGDGLGNSDFAGTFCANERESHHWLTIDAGQGAHLGRAIDHPPEFTQSCRTSTRQGDADLRDGSSTRDAGRTADTT